MSTDQEQEQKQRPISETIKLLRMRMMITQEKMARLIGVSVTTINRWENGVGTPSLTSLGKLQALAKGKKIK